MSNDPLVRARTALTDLRASFRLIHLATVSADGAPDASLAPALLDQDDAFVIYVSGLAAHTQNLAANPRASVLLTFDDAAPGNPFAQPRLTFACAAEVVARDSAAFAPLALRFRESFGATVDLLAGLPDFRFIRLVPTRGRYVAGFGETYLVEPRDWSPLQRVGPQNLKP